MQEIYCPQCGKQIQTSEQICPHCSFERNRENRKINEAGSPEKSIHTTVSAYAPFWKRTVAFFVDITIYFVLSFIFFDLMLYHQPVIALFSPLLVYFFYKSGFEASALQATPGKLLVGILVTDLEGNRIGYGRSVVRFLCFSFLSSILCIGFIFPAFTEKKQALHDLLANTLVVEKK